MRSHEEYREMLSAYALGALDAEETSELEAYVATREDLRAELDVWSETAAMIAFAAPAAEPSPKVRDNILASVRALKANKSLDQAKEQTNGQEEQAQTQQSNVIPFPVVQKQRSFWNVAQVITAVAASIAIIFLAFLAWSSSQREKESRKEVADLKNRLDQVQKQLNQQSEDLVLFTSPEANNIILKGFGTAPNAQAHLAYNRATGQAVIYADKLPALPQGKAYQIWYIADLKNPTPGKTFKPDANGRAVLRDQIPRGGLQASVFAVTIEDEKGATVPALNTICLQSASS
jgi:anti-sigma-K factor RskA